MEQYSTFHQFLIIYNEYKITTVQFENKYYINDFSRVKLFKEGLYRSNPIYLRRITD